MRPDLSPRESKFHLVEVRKLLSSGPPLRNFPCSLAGTSVPSLLQSWNEHLQFVAAYGHDCHKLSSISLFVIYWLWKEHQYPEKDSSNKIIYTHLFASTKIKARNDWVHGNMASTWARTHPSWVWGGGWKLSSQSFKGEDPWEDPNKENLPGVM